MGFGRVALDGYSEEMKIGVVDFICYRYNQWALEELRSWLGDEAFLEMLNTFAGTYITLPTTKRLLKLYYDFQAAICLKKIRVSRKNKDLKTWVAQEEMLQKIAKKTKRKYGCVLIRAGKILKELEKVREWKRKNAVWKNKYLKSDP